MKARSKRFAILIVVVLIAIEVIFLLNRKSVLKDHGATIQIDNVAKQDAKQNIMPTDWTVKDFVDPPYPHKEPVIQIGCVDENGNVLQLESVYLLPVEDRSSRGWICEFEGAQSVQFMLVEGPAKVRQIRAGIRYYATFSSKSNGAQSIPRIEFTSPQFESEKNVYRVKLIIQSSAISKVKSPMPVPKTVQLEGAAPVVPPEVKNMTAFYLNEQKFINKGVVVSGAPFKLDVDSIGGDLAFFDIDTGILYGLKLSVKNQVIGNVELIDGYRKYRFVRSSTDLAMGIELFPQDQDRVPLAFGVFKPGIAEISVMAVPEKYRLRVGELDIKKRKKLPFREVELGEETTVHLD